MAYRFDNGFAKTVEVYEKYWKGELDRGLFPVIVRGETDRPQPPKGRIHGCTQLLFANREIPPKELVDCIEYALSGLEYLGDAFPYVNMDFSGPGLVAALVGGKLGASDHGIWFSSEKEAELADMHFEYDAGNYWLNRIKDITLECKSRFGKEVVLGIPDLGGAIDILASLRGTQNLLMDFYDAPEEIKRLINELSGLWHIFFEEIAALYCRDNVYTNWSGLLSRESSYMFQADFAYMIGPEMFDEFLLPELKYSFGKVKRACYHLDGTGELPHLDSLLQSEDLKLVQWIPGAGTTSVDHWIDVHNKILNAGKLLQACDDREKQLDKIIETRGSLKGVASLPMTFEKKDRGEALRLLEKYSY
ncbi:MAG: hypothetical protein LBH43_09785 [Treponema sp.]|jgi:5-methyltetrahydrofolate--homocysteine methyltransferase|nr:hypothetical protein [Treponema sp.]